MELKNEDKPFWAKALDAVVPPASSKLHVQPEEENVTSTFASVEKKEKKTEKKKKRVPVDDIFGGIDDEILGE